VTFLLRASLKYLFNALVSWKVLMMSRRRGNLFAGSYDEELREALATNPNFVQAPNFRGSYMGTSAEEAAPDASDPPYSPTAASKHEGRDTAQNRFRHSCSNFFVQVRLP
jgi:hypothetical protein